jgi:cell division protein FtsA
MYATCIGLILKGYNDYDHKYKEFNEKFVKVAVPAGLTKQVEIQKEEPVLPVSTVDVTIRKERFWDKFKNNLIDLFKEEEDQVIR